MREIETRDFSMNGQAPEVERRTPAALLQALPYLLWHNVIPPMAVANEIFRAGEFGAGMSGGVTWDPFELDEAGYAEMADALAEDFGADLVRDPDLDAKPTYSAWMRAVLLTRYPDNAGIRALVDGTEEFKF
ncbi:MAG: hypothetical protein AAF074_23615 [Pseudomonadota bacterium]